MPLIGSFSATPTVEQTAAFEYGWIITGSGTTIAANEAHRQNTYRIYRKAGASATAIIYASNAAVGATYYLESRYSQPKPGALIYDVTETWRKTGTWATGALV